MSASDKFWDKTAEKYSKKKVPDEEKYKKKLSETQEFLTKDMHVLEFGCGTGTTAIHLVPNRTQLIAEVARILKPGGVFVSSTGYLGNSYFRFLKILIPILKPLGIMPDVFMFSEAELAAEIKNAGFSIDRQWHSGPQNIEVFIIAKKC